MEAMSLPMRAPLSRARGLFPGRSLLEECSPVSRSAGPEAPVPLSIRELPRSERPRERLRDHGAASLSAAELIAIIVGSGGTGRSALAVGQSILESAGGSLRRIAAQPVASLTLMRGVGSARAATVHAALELGRRMAAEGRDEGAPMRSP